jgi:hypothetical protein
MGVGESAISEANWELEKRNEEGSKEGIERKIEKAAKI